jgi:hypothetical protein
VPIWRVPVAIQRGSQRTRGMSRAVRCW